MSKLEELLKYVSEHNDFYKNKIKEYGVTDPTDITQYHILTRKQLQENRYNMFSEGYQSEYFNQKLRRQFSSGSTGVPVNIYWDYKDWYASNMTLWRRRFQWYGICPSDRYIMFTLNAFNIQFDSEHIYHIQESENLLVVNISLIHNNDKYCNLIEIIDEFRPSWLYIQPFVLEKLINAYKFFKKNPPKTLKYIESVGELLSSKLKQRAVNFFCVPVANLYGSEEMNGIAYECPYHHMHVLDDNVFIECLNNKEINNCGEGDAIITSLKNRAMPLIRYNQGDQIVLAHPDKTCLCGSNSSIICMIKGRSLNSIIVNEKIEINSFMLLEVVAEVNNQFGDVISSYKYVYIKSEKRLQCFVAIKETRNIWYLNIKRTIESVFLSKITPAEGIIFEVLKMNANQSYNQKFKVLEIID